MRAIDATLKARIQLAQQTLYNNAEPKMDVTVSRPRTPITRAGFWQESIVTAGATAICTSVAVRRMVDKPTRAYVAYVTDAGSLVVKYAELNTAISRLIWITVETIADCTACAIDFDGHFANLVSKNINYLTDELPWLFYVTSAGALKGGILGETYDTLVASNVMALDAIRGVASKYKDLDQGLLLFYIIGGDVYYNQLIAGVWTGQEQVTLAPANSVSIKAERVFDWRIVLQVMDNTGALYEIFTKMEASGWNGTDFIQITDITIATALIEVFYSEYQNTENISVDVGIDAWNMATYSPTLLRAWNIATSTEDPENPGTYYDDYGYRVVFEFDECIMNAVAYPADFKLVDAYNNVWYGQSVQQDYHSRFVTVTFTDFNNAGNDVTAVALAGNLWNGLTMLTETSVEFTATELVPTFIPAPVPVSIWNIDNKNIIVKFDLPIASINSQSGFAVSGYEPSMSPEGALIATNYVNNLIAHDDPSEANGSVALNSGTFDGLVV